MAHLRSQRGQATIDYVALIAIMTLLLGAAAAVAGGGANGVVNALHGQVRRALCIVTGGSCPAQSSQPCVVASDRRAVHIAISVAIFRVDKDRALLRERLSDGTVRLTLVQRSGIGLEVGAGGRARLQLKGRTIGLDREARGGAQGIFGSGKVYLARDDREADEILRGILRPRLPIFGGGPRPRQVFVEGGLRALGQLGIGDAAVAAGLEGLAEGVLGAKRDLRSGEITIALSSSASVWALLSAAMVGPTSSAERDAGLSLTLDRRHRPIGLSLTASGTLTAGPALAPALASALGARGTGTTADLDGRHWQLSASVDLRDPDVALAWAAFRHDPTSGAAIRALGERLRAGARLDVRTYAQQSAFDGAAAGLALGAKLDGEVYVAHDRTRLLSAATRPPGGLWEQRFDCVPA